METNKRQCTTKECEHCEQFKPFHQFVNDTCWGDDVCIVCHDKWKTCTNAGGARITIDDMSDEYNEERDTRRCHDNHCHCTCANCTELYEATLEDCIGCSNKVQHEEIVDTSIHHTDAWIPETPFFDLCSSCTRTKCLHCFTNTRLPQLSRCEVCMSKNDILAFLPPVLVNVVHAYTFPEFKNLRENFSVKCLPRDSNLTIFQELNNDDDDVCFCNEDECTACENTILSIVFPKISAGVYQHIFL